MENEVWRDIVDYEGRYKVSDLGRVKSIKHGKEKMLKPSKTMGYPRISLYKLLLAKSRLVHQLVAESFIDKDYKSKGLVVNHINFKRDDNRLLNLELITPRENTNFKHIPSISKYTGVFLDKTVKKWKSSISINGRNKHLGMFIDEKEASEYYEAALICVKEGRIKDIVVKSPSFTSKYRGVFFAKRENKWIAKIKQNGKGKHLGYFDNEKAASDYYEDALICAKDNRFEGIKSKRASASSKYKGVSFYKGNNKWRSYFNNNGERKFIGYFNTEQQAYDALVEYRVKSGFQ